MATKKLTIETEKAYKKLAEYHFEKMEKGSKSSAEDIKNYLDNLLLPKNESDKAKQITPATYYKLKWVFVSWCKQAAADARKNNKSHDWAEKRARELQGTYSTSLEDIAKTQIQIKDYKNRLTDFKKKPSRSKKASESDFEKLKEMLTINAVDMAVKKGGKRRKLDDEGIALSYLTIVKRTGCRPCEVMSIVEEMEGSGRFKILGAKKNESLKRGLDRVVQVKQEYQEEVRNAVLNLKKQRGIPDLHTIAQKRLQTASKKAFPKQKIRPTLYSFRHQLASDMKKAKVSLVEISEVLGHQSTRSQSRYGKHGSGSLGPSVSATNEGKGVRDTHSTSYKKQLEKNKVSDAIETPVQKIDMAKIETVLNSAYKATELANKLLASTSNQSQNRPKPR